MSEREPESLPRRLLGLLGLEELEPLLGDEQDEPRRARNAKRRSRNAYKRRTARAKLLGYRSYYDYRIHDYGRRPPGEKVSKAARERRRGHRSYQDLLRALERLPGDAAVAPIGFNRDASSGQWGGVSFLILYPDREEEFVLRGRWASESSLRRLRERMDELDIRWQHAPSLDVFAAGESQAA